MRAAPSRLVARGTSKGMTAAIWRPSVPSKLFVSARVMCSYIAWRLDNVVKPDKPGDFVGKQALRKIAQEGTPRLLTTLRIEGDEVPEYGAAVTADGREVGIVRSPAQSPTFDMQVIAMAAIDRDLAQEGTTVDVALGDGTVQGTVASFPIYDPEKKRPRS